MRNLLAGIGIGIALVVGVNTLRPVAISAARFDMTNQGSGVFTIKDTISGSCWLMVDRGGSASVATAPPEACK